MERTPCFGRCPHYKVEIKKDGTVFYEGIKNGDFFGERKGKLSPKATQKFFKEIAKYKLASLKDVYKPFSTDLPHLNLSFVLNGKNKSIKNGESGPEYLETIGKKIDSLIKPLKWMRSTREPEPPFMEEQDVNAAKMEESYETEPKFVGGYDAMQSFIRANLVYPSFAKENGIEGAVICSFLVDKKGAISDVKVLKGIDASCNQEAIRLIQSMPNWQPAKGYGVAMDKRFTLPIKFKLE